MATTFAQCPIPKLISTSIEPGVQGYCVDVTSRKGRVNQQQGTITESYFVTAASVDAFVQFAAGVPQTTGVGGASVTLRIPLSWPGNANFYASDIEWEMMAAGPSFWLSSQPYSIGKVTITYSTVPYPTNGTDAFKSVTMDVGGSNISVPGSVYKFSDGTACETGAGTFVPEQVITVTCYRQASVNLAGITALSGTVNAAPFTVMGVSYAAQTVLFLGGSISVDQTLIGSPMFTVAYKINWRPVNWNYALHPNGTTGFAEIIDGNGNPPFQTADFTQVFPGGL